MDEIYRTERAKGQTRADTIWYKQCMKEKVNMKQKLPTGYVSCRCGNMAPVYNKEKTKAEERLIKAALRELPSIQPIDPESSFGKAVETVRKERNKK